MKKAMLFFLVVCFVSQSCHRGASQWDTPVPEPKNDTIPFVYALQGVTWETLSRNHPSIVVVDWEDSQINPINVPAKTIGYLSIGEVEEYEEYLPDNDGPDWEVMRDEWGIVIEPNPDFPDNHRVKFWDHRWKEVIYAKALQLLHAGFDGVYLDVVDVYQYASVRQAYQAEFGNDEVRKAMEQFVIEISELLKAENPRFKVVPQNAIELYVLEDETKPNTPYLDAIDGVGIEDLFYDDDEENPYTQWDLPLVRVAKDHGKLVLATSYPTNPSQQSQFVQRCVEEGFIPFLANRELDEKFADIPANFEILELLRQFRVSLDW